MSPDQTLARLLLDVALVVAAAYMLRGLLVRLHQPSVLAQVLAGIALGPSLLGRLPGDPSSFLFPVQVRSGLALLGSLGLVLFAFIVGLELNLAVARRHSRALIGITVGALALPFAVGAALAALLYASHHRVHGHSVPAPAFTLFMATSMSVTAFPVLVAILRERGMRRTSIGELAVGSAALQDLVGWILLAAALATLSAAGGGPHMVRVAMELAAFVLVLGVVLRPLLRAILARKLAGGGLDLLALALAYALVCAGATQLIGVHDVFGAFAAGVAFPRAGEQVRDVARAIAPVTLAVLLPLYFLTPGLQVDIGGIGGRGLAELALITFAACASKLLGASIPARLAGMRWRETMPLAVLLNTRGLMELVVLTVGYTEGVLDRNLFSELVLMAILTTTMTGPLLDLLRGRGIAAAGEPAGAAGRRHRPRLRNVGVEAR